MNIKNFYFENKRQEEENFSQQTGLNIRHSFQPYNQGKDTEDIFAVKTVSQKECIGIEFNKVIFYLLPVSRIKTILFIFDDSLMPVIEALADYSDARFDAFIKHTPTLASALYRNKHNLSEYCACVDEGMLCFAKELEFPLTEKIKEGDLLDFDLLTEVISLINIRNQCEKEILSFDGFTSSEERNIAIKEGLSQIKRGIRIMRASDWLFTND